MANHFQVLGVSPSASEQEIKTAFRRLARIYHPDMNPSPDAAERFKQIAEAYHILSDPRLRQSYRSGHLVGYDEYLRRLEFRRAVSRRIDAAIEEMLRQDREEEIARQTAVRTVVSLFLSAFAASLARPRLFETLGLTGQAIVLILFLLGCREIAINLGLSFKRFTYVDQMTSTLLNAPAPPTQPFSRSTAIRFLVIGYLACVGAGLALGEWLHRFDPWMRGAPAYLGIMLLPPIGVLIINRLGRLGERRPAE